MISYFELLQLIKDGKEPKKIKLYLISDNIGKEYKAEYDCCDFSYYGLANMDEENENYKYYLSECFLESNMFDKKIEIIEEKKIPEKLENEHEFYSYVKYEENKNEIDKVLYILKAINLTEEKIDNLNNSVNEIIDYLNSKGE